MDQQHWFSTSADANAVREAILAIIDRLTDNLGEDVDDIVRVVHGRRGNMIAMRLSERERRVIRSALRRALADLR